jgi:N4-gp56 family major capsid protein
MALTTTATGSLPPAVQHSLSMKMLAWDVPNMIHNMAATHREMDANSGMVMRMRRPLPLQPALVPLGNSGITPPSQSMTALDLDVKMEFYGTWVQINEQVILQSENPELNYAAERLAISMRTTEDILMRDMLCATATLLNAVGGINGDNPTNLNRTDLSAITGTLLGNNASTITSIVGGENKMGTAPIRNCYVAMCHTDLTVDLEGITGFQHVSQYPNQGSVSETEFGVIGNVRFYISSLGSIVPNASALGADVYQIPVVGLDAYTAIEQNGYSSSYIYMPPTDPLRMNCSAAYKMAFAGRVTNDLWALRVCATLG